MLITCKDVEVSLRAEMSVLSRSELVKFATDMGVITEPGMSRAEIEEECVCLELCCFVQ